MNDVDKLWDAAQAVPTDNQVKSLAQSIKGMLDAQDRVNGLEAALEEAKAELRRYATGVVPEAFAAAGVQDFTIPGDGNRPPFKCEVKDHVDGSLPSLKEQPEKRDMALTWLRRHGHGDIIKNKIVVFYPARSDKKALAQLKRLQKAGWDAEMQSDVPHQTLKKWAREMLEQGQAPDLETLGLWHGKKATLKEVKK